MKEEVNQGPVKRNNDNDKKNKRETMSFREK